MIRESPQEKNKVGLIGSGYGYHHLLPVLKSIGGLETTFALPRKHNKDQINYIVNSGVKIAKTADIIEDKEINFIFLAVPPNLQLELGKAVLENNKGLYCEKPVGISFFETNHLYNLSRNTKKNTYVGFQFRFDPGIIAIKKLLETNLLGKILEMEVNWHTSGTSAIGNKLNWRNNIVAGGGVHRDFLCHVVDYLKWITNGVIFPSLKNLSVDTNYKSSIFDIKLKCPDSNSELIKINISRGNVPISYWEIKIIFESGQVTLSATSPFSTGSYKTILSGSRNFCILAKEFVNEDKYLKGTAGIESAREYALRFYFEQIIDNIFQNGENILPTLEDAKFTQQISDYIQNFL